MCGAVRRMQEICGFVCSRIIIISCSAKTSGTGLPREASRLVNPKSSLGLTNPENAIMCGAVQRMQEICGFVRSRIIIISCSARTSGIGSLRETSDIVNPKSRLGLTNPENAIMCGAIREWKRCVFLNAAESV